jgi:glycosyltransferase involved in cell wall biosynthesis
VTSIHNWADGDAIRPIDPSASALRSEWGWDERFVVLYSGNMGLAHEFETALDAAALLADEPKVLFSFLGGGPRRDEIERGVRERGLANVELRPYVARERLGESLTAGDVHLVSLRPSLAGMLVPSKIYGILAAGRPTLYVGPPVGEIADIIGAGACGTRVAPGPPVGEIADIIGAGACGTRVAPGDARELADAVRGYLRDDARVKLEGRRARALFEERFTKERGLREFAALLRTIGPGGGGDEEWR